MNRMFRLSRIVAVSALLFFVLAAVKCKDDCEGIICEPCPSSKVVIRYEDNLGNCPPSFHQTARVYALNISNPLDTVYRYSLNDSCTASFLIQDDVVYHIVSNTPPFSQTVQILDWEFQSGIEVTECCMCYPLEHANVLIDGDSTHVEFPDSSYESNVLVKVIN